MKRYIVQVLIAMIIIAVGVTVGHWLKIQIHQQKAPTVDGNTYITGRSSPLMSDLMSDNDLVAVANDVNAVAEDRNEAMERLSFQLPSLQAMTVLDQIAHNTSDSDMCRSWSVQHLGILTQETIEPDVRNVGLKLLRHLAHSMPEGKLVRREALFALLNIGVPEDVAWITELTKAGLAQASPDRDLWARFAGMLRLHDQIPKLRECATSKAWALRMSAREALKRLGDNGDEL
jgi:hypothetical protein